MKLTDYLRLGFAGVKAHKGRAFTVVIIVGVLFGVMMAGAFVLQGLENAVLGTMLEPTGGKVLVVSNVDSTICRESCDLEAEVERMKRKVEEYGGEVVEAETVQMAGEVFYRLEEGVLSSTTSSDDAVAVAMSLRSVVEMAEVEMPDWTASVTKRVQAVAKAREELLGKVIEDGSGVRYQVTAILPGRVYISDLSLSNVGQKKNLLNVIVDSISTGESLNFVVGEVKKDLTETEELGTIFAKFPDVESADRYYRDEVNYCTETDRMFSMCSKKYRYQTTTAISDPLGVYEKFQGMWSVFRIAAAVLAIVGAIIALSTYGRLIGKDVKIIALYHAMGANGRQVRMVYMIYLLMLSAMAVGFAIVVGLALAAVLSLVNMAALGQVFALGFGVMKNDIWMIGWNNVVWGFVGAMMAMAMVAVVLGNGQFKVRELARRMK